MSGAQAVYGLRLTGLPGGGPAAPADWEAWTVEQRVGEADDAEGMTVRTQTARVGLPGAGELLVDRNTRTITFAVRRPLAPDALLHPGIVPAAAIIAFWQGRAPVHASAVLVNDRVWGLLADREGGKSTTAALLADRDVRLFTDDMLIVAGGEAFAGPASVDLREEAARALGGKSLGVVGTRERWRKSLPVERSAAPLAGWVLLEWSTAGDAELSPMDAGERIAAIERHASLPVTGEQLLDLAAVPMLRFRRPRVLDRAGPAVDLLLERLRAA